MPRVAPHTNGYAVKDLQVQRTRAPLSLLQITGALFNWCLWFFMMLLMLSQLLTAIRNTTTKPITFTFGRDVSRGLYNIVGDNDEPYTDRLVVCVRRGRSFLAMSLNDALASGNTIVEDSTGSAIHGYRVIHRTGHALTEHSRQQWTQTCRLMSDMLAGIYQACEDLGYTNLTQDSLRIMDENILKNIPKALPVLIMPFWDNAMTARYAIPAWNGHACLFRLSGQFEDPARTTKYLVGVHRTKREGQTITWLDKHGGEWKNGWYEDKQGMRWYSDIAAMKPGNNFGLFPHFFDTALAKEIDCPINSDCSTITTPYNWISELRGKIRLTTETTITISNGAHFGLFYFRSDGEYVVTCVYDAATLISNASVVMLLWRWMTAMILLHRGYIKKISGWHSAGIGSIAHASSFVYLPIAMVPRLKMILAAFFTIGCDFEGRQKALSDSWFVMYPSIVDFVLIYASLLNTVARLLRRRMSDWIFPFTIVLLTIMHYVRQRISLMPLLKLDGRLNSIVDSVEFERLTPIEMLSPNVALRMGGNVPMILWAKLLILSLSILSLLLSDDMTIRSKRSRTHIVSGAEQALNIRVCNVGGIGRSRTPQTSVLGSYELLRLGYVVFGNRYLMTIDDWLVLSTMTHARKFYSLWNHRIMVFQVLKAKSDERLFHVSSYGQLMSIHDPVLNAIPWWDIDVRPLL